MIHYISGGERSGKTSFAQNLAQQHASHCFYLATCRSYDGSMQTRIDNHKKQRDHHWTTIEEDLLLNKVITDNMSVVIDCITLWLMNIYSDNDANLEKCLTIAQAEIDKLTHKTAYIFIISNEIGMGLIADNAYSRKFVELQGWVNQYIAKKAHKATFMVSGLPLHLK